ncbi:MAG: hypothetical protein H0T85_10095 [Geodermatophilaceae bacterium]|nr:hypothetical protein [Geodermatophilaceae bacterium]
MSSHATRPERDTAIDPGGMIVVACLGHRCAGLHIVRTDQNGLGPLSELKSAVRTSVAGVLITTGCMGPCSQGAVVGVGHRVARRIGERLVAKDMMLLGGIEQAPRLEALTTWFADGGPARTPLPAPLLTEALLRNPNLSPPPGPGFRPTAR